MKENTQGVDSQPSSVTELEPLVKEFISELKRIDSEIEILTIDRKELFEKYSEKIDVKTLKQAMRVQAIRDKVSRKDTFDTFVSILEGDL
ncbi:MAG TPA: hypothetical protein PLP33_10355 [Leptospiraceae bacterium]|jgi:uncharacterized protein (UPF0335 family)|nr:hypothetical protein [Leptospiraceae bacterium]